MPSTRFFSRRHPPEAFSQAQQTREKKTWWTILIGLGAGGGKLISGVGASFIGAYLVTHKNTRLALGAPFLTAGGLSAAVVALLFFGPDVHRLYPDVAWTLKTISIGSALCMVGGNLLSGWAEEKDRLAPFYAGSMLYTLGNGLMSISFRNFIAISELQRGRPTVRLRLPTLVAMALASIGTLATLNLVHHDPHFLPRYKALALALGTIALATSFACERLISPRLLGVSHPHVVRQGLAALGIAALVGISAANKSFAPQPPYKSLVLSLASAGLFGAVAIDESEQLRHALVRDSAGITALEGLA